MAMPDIHWGYGFPIGGVAAFDPDEGGVVSPGGVGYDINCGVRLHATKLGAQDVSGHLKTVLSAIYNTIPSGVGRGRRDIGRSTTDIQKAMKKGAAWAKELGLADESDLELIEEGGCLPADPEVVSPRAIERGRGQVGTLGSGNHFIEIGRVAEIFDQQIADVFGLSEGQLTVLVHSGSRGLGYQVCDDSIRAMNKAVRKYSIELPDRQLCCAPVDSPEGEEYLKAMGSAANFAFANRQIMGHQVGELLARVLEIGPDELGYRLVYDVCHNIAKLEEHRTETTGGKKKTLCVHRKGATRALPPGHPLMPTRYRKVGQPVLVPGDLGTQTFVLAGAEGSTESFASCCHGAGRVLSRKKAKQAARGRSIFQELEEKHIWVQAASRRTLSEELPEAYKNVAEVADVVEGAGLAKKVARLEPMAVLKG
jgi:tRNA-splicing ligase RtcB